MSKVEIYTTDSQKILTMNIVMEGLVAKIHKALLQNNGEKINNLIKNGLKMGKRWIGKF